MLESAFPALAVLHGETGFSWTRWDIHPSVLIGCTLFAGLYLAVVGPLRHRFEGSEPVSGWRRASFLSGVLILFAALNGPLHELSDNYLFSAHMVQHLLLTLFAAPLWIIGAPAWMLRPLLRGRVPAAILAKLTSPLIAFAVYNIVFAGWHIPGMYNYALENHDAHIVQHLMFIAAAVMMWWPAINPLPELRDLQSPIRLLYLFAIGIPMSIISALITLSGSVLYTFYDAQPRVFSLTSLDDQQLGGLIMWIPGGMVFWVAISIIYFRWARQEEQEQTPFLTVS
jgi:putative membrane protein